MADFKTAFLITIDDNHEGGYQCLHGDSGNWTGGVIGVGELKGTKYGISAHEFPNEDIKNLTTDRAAELYRDGYWKALYSQIADQLIADKLFDMGVLFGVGTAVRMLQRALKIVEDGVFGAESLAAVNSRGNVQEYKTALVSHVLLIGNSNPEERQFITGWIRRINS